MKSWRSAAAAISVFRIVLGLLILASVAVQLMSAAKTPDFNPANFFGFFTIVSNIFAAFVLLLVAGVTKLSPRNQDVLRGAAVLSLAIVGLVFSILLAKLESNVIPWVNIVLHYVAPAAIIFDWLLDPPRTALKIRDGVWWLALPFAYIAYTLLRGSAVHWYPYPFLNVDLIGGAVIAYCVAIFALGLVLAVALIAIGNRLRNSSGLRNSDT
ncbi:MAG: Pr6Pr family membrane protein [Candidatus Eremiobacteraeota bacterium]|nr:Pr6Pr family membrane protein [Candidatus Eremiobacteraeota bacterium]